MTAVGAAQRSATPGIGMHTYLPNRVATYEPRNSGPSLSPLKTGTRGGDGRAGGRRGQGRGVSPGRWGRLANAPVYIFIPRPCLVLRTLWIAQSSLSSLSLCSSFSVLIFLSFPRLGMEARDLENEGSVSDRLSGHCTCPRAMWRIDS